MEIDVYHSDRMTLAEMQELWEAAQGMVVSGAGHVRVSHENCPAGRDTRERVYITRAPHTAHTFLIYCHNCGRGGRYSTGKEGPRNYRRLSTILDIPGKLPPKERRALWDRASAVPHGSREHVWLESFGLGANDIVGYGFRYSDSLRRLLIPTYKDPSAVSGFQARTFDPKERAKYITYPFEEPLPLTYFFSGPAYTAPLVVCEDIVSAVKVFYKTTGVAAVPLLNSNANPELVLPLAKVHQKAIIWFDNDKPEVIKHSKELAERLKLAGVDVRVVPPPYKDPKRHTVAEIKQVIGTA